ncbi:MAG: hypothetical protein QOI11_642 [Candidatus Eremiobacteraeota bacterium]|nr:hypothetical protein [Candidatus Eremiobacteraeota bacterium]
MSDALPAADPAFRAMVRAFVDEHLPADLRDREIAGDALSKDDYRRWHRIVDRRGWVAASWPVEHGGPGWTPLQQHVFDEECWDAGAPTLLPFGLRMIGPVLIAHGTPEQQARFLPRIRSGDDFWCQGYSEPDAGSDLASLRTRARRAGDGFTVDGQKTWTTLGAYADWMFCLVRVVEGADDAGRVSLLLIDLRSPGVTVRPIAMIDGSTHEIAEVFFDDVRVPGGNLVGGVGKGLSYARQILARERTEMAMVGRSKRLFKLLVAAGSECGADGRVPLADARFRGRVAEAEIELRGLDALLLRTLADGAPERGPLVSLLKLKGAEVQQQLAELVLDGAGASALARGGAGHALERYLNLRKTTIYGGATEIHKNLVAQLHLEL